MRIKVNKYSILIVLIYVSAILSIFQLSDGYYYKANGYTTHYMYYQNENSMASITQSLIYFIYVVMGFSYFKQSNERLPIMKIVVSLLITLGWSLISIIQLGDIRSYFSTGTSPYILLSVFCIYLGTNESIWYYIRKYSLKIAILYIGSAFFFFITSVINYGLTSGGTPHIILLSIGIWFLMIALFASEGNVALKQILLAVCAVISVGYGSRGWTLLCGIAEICFLIKMHGDKKESRRLKFIIAILVLSMIIYFVGFGYLEQQLDAFSERLFQDTRTKQYDLLFEQFDLGDLVFGTGMEGGYEYKGREGYGYFDNAFVFVAIHFGIVQALCYLFLIVCPIGRLFFHRKNYQVALKQPKSDIWVVMVLLVWFLAMMGLSVYNGLTYDVRNVVIMITIGRSYVVLTNRGNVIRNRRESFAGK